MDPKLRQKYAFLWKDREEMTPAERRWKWVKKDALPKDLQMLMESLTKKKKKSKDAEGAEKKDKQKKTGDESEEELLDTQVHVRNDLEVDYSQIVNVKEKLQILKEERIKSKFSATFHVAVLTKMSNEMPFVEYKDLKLKVEVLILLVGTLFQTVKTSYLTRD